MTFLEKAKARLWAISETFKMTVRVASRESTFEEEFAKSEEELQRLRAFLVRMKLGEQITREEYEEALR